jgi:ABC-type antimicrobial peptide transport system permease subunit
MALGATRGSISWMVIRAGAVLVVVGMVIGLLGSIAIARLISTMLFQVEPYDPMTYAGGLLCLSVIALVACYVPAVRAARIDPFRALRVE